MKYPLIYLFLCSLILWNCQKDASTQAELEVETEVEIASTLPLYVANLNDFSEFDDASENWKIVGKSYTDFVDAMTLQTEVGSGIIVVNQADNVQLSTNMQHGDLILELEYMLSKDARATLLFQEKYPLTLMDSWGKSTTENGAIEAAVPKVNTSRAPGLWQQLKVQFRAAKFDEQGSKITNPRVDYVYLNDVLIQDSVEFMPTILMQPELAHLMFQVEKGSLAIRNLEWKKLAQNRVTASNITYQLFKGLAVDHIPDFSQMTADERGTVENFEDLEGLAQMQDNFGIVFEGDLNIPTDGTYLFETSIDDGGDLYIDNQLLVHNEGEPGMGTERALIELTKGVHPFKMTFYEEVWMAWLEIQVEGPSVEKHKLFSNTETPLWQRKKSNTLLLEVEASPIFQRAFVNYGNEKRTHTISVGDPAGVHYSYDLREGSLLKAWKGNFADVDAMWRGRGEPQLLKPLNAVVEFTAGTPLAHLNSENSKWRNSDDNFKAKGYQIDDNELPIFEYELGAIEFTDRIRPTEGKLQRTLNFKGEKRSDLWYRIARANSITALKNGWYNIDGKYYLKINSQEEVNIRESEKQQELILPILRNGTMDEVSYEVLW